MDAPGTPFRYDPFSQDARRDPYAFYPTLIEHYPAYFIPEYDAYVFTRYDDVWNAFVNSGDFTESEGQVFSRDQMIVHHRNAPPPMQLDPMTMFLFLDPPMHGQFRRAIGAPFLKGNIAKLRGEITTLVRDRLKVLLPKGEFDLNGDFGSYVSVGAVALVMGLPLSDAPRVIELVNTMVARAPDRSGPTEGGTAAREELMAFLKECIARRRLGQGPDSHVIDGMIAGNFIDRPLTDAEIAISLLGILVGGTETVPKIVAAGMLELARRPEQLAAVRADLENNVVPAFEEMLRFSAPAQWFGRTAKNKVRVGDVELEPGQRAILVIAAANRDPREFENPDEFIWNRKAQRMLSFGIGPHFCIGIHLARLEGQIMIRELLASVGEYTVHPDEGEWPVSEFQIGWVHLPIRFKPIAS